MAEYVYGSSVPYRQYLQENAYVRDITGNIKKSGEATRHEISSQTREIVTSNEQLSQEFGAGFDSVNGTLEIGFNRVESALGNVEASIESLHSDFNYNMGLVLDQLQIQNQLTFSILEKLDAIQKTLETPRLTQARECYNIGCERLSKGLLDKALEAFLKAEERNDTDFFTEFQIGKLYLYGVDEDDNIIDLSKAEQHLRNAIRYGKAEVSLLPEFKRWVGESLLHASIACYVQANDQRINGNIVKEKEFISEAFKLAQQACAIYPSLSESQYHLAKYAALIGHEEISVQSLEKAVLADVNYCLKIEFDRDFDDMRPQVFGLFERLRMNMSETARRRLQESAQKYITDMVYLSDDAKKGKIEIDILLSNTEKKISENTLLDIHEALQILNRIELIFLSICNQFIVKYSIKCIMRRFYGISPDGELIAAGCQNNIELWQVSDGKLIQTLPSKIAGPTFSPDGKLIAVNDYDTVEIFQVSDGKLIQTLPSKIAGPTFSPDGKLIASTVNNTVQIFQVSGGKLINTLPGNGRPTFSPDGKLIASTVNNTVQIFQVSGCELINTLPGDCPIIFSPDGKLIVVGDDGNRTVEIFQVSDGKLIQTLPVRYFGTFSPDGDFFIINPYGDTSSLNIWGRQAIPRKDIDQHEHFVKTLVAVIENNESEQHVQDKNAANAEKRLREYRKRNGICLVCGAKLGFSDKLHGRTACKQHSS